MRRDPTRPHRLLVIADETIASRALHDALLRCARNGRTEVLLVAPAARKSRRHETTADRAARHAAQERLLVTLDALRADAIDAEGYVGCADPLDALEDALRLFAADEILIVTRPAPRSAWLQRNLPALAAERFPLPILQLAADDGDETRDAVTSPPEGSPLLAAA